MKNESILYADPTWNKKGKAITQVPSLNMDGKQKNSLKIFSFVFWLPASKRALPKTKTLASQNHSLQLSIWEARVMVFGCHGCGVGMLSFIPGSQKN